MMVPDLGHHLSINGRPFCCEKVECDENFGGVLE
jgi:hypothetical protein